MLHAQRRKHLAAVPPKLCGHGGAGGGNQRDGDHHGEDVQGDAHDALPFAFSITAHAFSVAADWQRAP
ncbi:hypothetical protein SAMN05518668_104399 [Sphingobium sp. YR657]|nr:hypothetical protein SAMN05518668_104399 [Sphingobium sp. YR657]